MKWMHCEIFNVLRVRQSRENVCTSTKFVMITAEGLLSIFGCCANWKSKMAAISNMAAKMAAVLWFCLFRTISQYWSIIKSSFWWLYPCFLGQWIRLKHFWQHSKIYLYLICINLHKIRQKLSKMAAKMAVVCLFRTISRHWSIVKSSVW